MRSAALQQHLTASSSPARPAGKGLFKDHKGASARGGRARGSAQAQNSLGPASAAKLAAARAADPTAELPDGMSGRKLGRELLG